MAHTAQFSSITLSNHFHTSNTFRRLLSAHMMNILPSGSGAGSILSLFLLTLEPRSRVILILKTFSSSYKFSVE